MMKIPKPTFVIFLELDDYRVFCASSAQEALSHSDWNKVSSILLDRKLPDGDAETILPQLKSLAPHARYHCDDRLC